MLIIEGTDLVGKTTLAKVLVHRLNHATWNTGLHRKFHYSHLSTLSDEWDYEEDYFDLIDDRTVMDRFYMSEIAYRVVKDDCMARINRTRMTRIEERLKTIGALTVLITSTPEFLSARYDLHRRQEMFTKDQVVAVDAEFMKLFNINRSLFKHDVMHYVVDDESKFVPEQASQIDYIIERYKEARRTARVVN